MTGLQDDLTISGGDVLTPAGHVVRADVVVRRGRIAEVRPAGSDGGTNRGAPHGAASVGRTLDATDRVVAPGFIDLQCNGAVGVDLTAEPEKLWEAAAVLPRWGITAWLPTIVTSPASVRQRALDALGAGPPAPTGAPGHAHRWATPLGLHFEGPFLAPERRGAHRPEHLRPPDAAAVTGWSRDSGVALVTLAPELPGALDIVRALVDRGVVVCAGHSSATLDQAAAAAEAGVRGVTHVFNAMAALHHRQPGLVAAALTDQRLAVGLIADGIHVHPAVVDLVARAAGSRLYLVSDAVAALGMPNARRLGDTEAPLDARGVRLDDGTLAGSNVSLDRGAANLMAYTGCGIAAAVDAASSAPARLLGLEGRRGAIAPGAVADLVLLDVPSRGVSGEAQTLSVVATLVDGVVAYHRDG